MNETELNRKSLQILDAFDNLQDLQLSNEWNTSLSEKLTSTKPSSSLYPRTSLRLIAFFFILVNLSFILNTVFKDNRKSVKKKAEYNLISKELLISSSYSNY